MAKSTALSTVGHEVPPGSNLAKKELLLLQASQAWGESFFRIGIVLRSIYEDEDWRDANYSNFSDYMNDRQPLGMVARDARRKMAAAERRKLLPDFNGEDRVGPLWTEWNIRPLTHKDFAPSDVRRIGKKIATRVKRGQPLTASLVKQLCDEERGVEQKKKKQQAKLLRDASLGVNLPKATKFVTQLRVAFEMYDEDSWLEIEETNPQLIKSLIRELDLFISFMKE